MPTTYLYVQYCAILPCGTVATHTLEGNLGNICEVWRIHIVWKHLWNQLLADLYAQCGHKNYPSNMLQEFKARACSLSKLHKFVTLIASLPDVLDVDRLFHVKMFHKADNNTGDLKLTGSS